MTPERQWHAMTDLSALTPTAADKFSSGTWTRGMAFELLDQLSLEHLYGAR
jgi:hypothetical protein